MSSEMERLKEEIAALRQENQYLSVQFSRLRKQELMSYLLKGNFLDVECILKDLAQFGIQLSRDDYMILCVRVLHGGDNENQETAGEDKMFYERHFKGLEDLIREAVSPHYEANVAHTDTGAVCLIGLERVSEEQKMPEKGKFLIKPPEPNVINRVNQIALNLYDRIQQELGIPVFIAVSRPCQGVEGIPEVYEDVRQIFEYQQMMTVDVPVLCYHDFELEEQARTGAWSSVQMERTYLRQVELGDVARARETMHQILRQNFNMPSLHALKIRTSAVFHALLITLDRFAVQEHTRYEAVLTQLRTVEQENITAAQLRELVDQVFDIIEESRQLAEQDSRPKWLTDMLGYIETHYREPDLNVSSLSVRFEMTPSYLSRETKQFTGSTLFDYIQKLRLEYAQILLSTGATTQEAAEGSGFGDVRSMRRAFQKYLGGTPRQVGTGRG